MVSSCGSLVGSTVRDAFALILTGLYFCHTHATTACLKCLFKFLNNGFLDCENVLHDGEDRVSPSHRGLGQVESLLECAIKAMTDQIDHADFNLLQFISSFLYVVLERGRCYRLPSSCIHRILCSLVIIAMRSSSGEYQLQSGTDNDCCSLDTMTMDHKALSSLSIRTFEMYFNCLEKFDECIGLQGDTCTKEPQQRREFVFSAAAATKREEYLTATDMVRDLVIGLVGNVAENVELSRVMVRTQELINRQSNYSNRAFWMDLITLAAGAFPQLSVGLGDRYVFASLCVLCTMASGEQQLHHPSHTAAEAELLVSRDVAVKLCGIQLLHCALQAVGCFSSISSVLGYEIRRLVPPIVLKNASSSLSNVQLFGALLNLVGTLLLKYRVYCKLELAVLIEKFVLKTLMGPSQYSIRLLILRELQLWMQEPNILVELFINYDMDCGMWTVQRRKVFESIVSSVCTLAEVVPPLLLKGGGSKKGMNASALFASTSSHPSDVIELHEEALQCAIYIMKHLTKASRCSSQFVERVPDAASGKENDDNDLELLRGSSLTDKQQQQIKQQQHLFGGYSPMPLPPHPPNNNTDLYKNVAQSSITTTTTTTQESQNNKHSSETASSEEEQEEDGMGKLFVDEYGGTAVVQKAPQQQHPILLNRPTSFYAKKEVRLRAEKIVEQALGLYQTKGLKKCVDFLIVSDYISDSPRDIATFLRVYHEELSPICIGEFLSEPDTDGKDKWRQVCFQYVKAISFHDTPLEKALRCFLTNCDFRLPGEAQKVIVVLYMLCTVV